MRSDASVILLPLFLPPSLSSSLSFFPPLFLPPSLSSPLSFFPPLFLPPSLSFPPLFLPPPSLYLWLAHWPRRKALRTSQLMSFISRVGAGRCACSHVQRSCCPLLKQSTEIPRYLHIPQLQPIRRV
ncbi:hypothetical protein F4678DRAFT_315862 [Xylaria arbuscula]|nr:hypothetical protein F4678DRAFT_315862 [Xylaria arbuscula]